MIDKLLNNYKRNIASIEMLKMKINEWQEILSMDAEAIDKLYAKPKEEKLGVQTSRLLNPIETMVIRVEDQKLKIVKLITDTQKRIKKLENDKQLVDVLLESLDEESKFIIIQKCCERKKWNIITYQFNNKYRNEYQEYITASGIRKRFEVIKKNLSDLLESISTK